MQINLTTNHIVDYELSKQIYDLGFRLPCRYYYDQWKFLKGVYPIPPSKKEGMSIIPAYEAGELLEYLPATLKLLKKDNGYEVSCQNPNYHDEWTIAEGKYLANVLAMLLVTILTHIDTSFKRRKIRTPKQLGEYWEEILPLHFLFK